MARADKRRLEQEALAKGWDQIRNQEKSSLRTRIWQQEEVTIVQQETIPSEQTPAPETVAPLEVPLDTKPSQDEVLKTKVTHPVFEMVRDAVRRSGFTHPEEGQFVMLPREFEAILALENKAVVQVVYLVLRDTIGWMDAEGRYKRREWVQLGQKHFEMTCGSKSQGFYGVKIAIQKGYIIRRAWKNTFEYSIRWKEKEQE